MKSRRILATQPRNGAVAALIALLLIPMLAMVALAVDYGYILVIRTDLQRAADNAALAAVQELIPSADGTQDLDAVRAAVREYAAYNSDNSSFVVRDADIEIGRFNPANVYTHFTIIDSGIFDTVRVTLRRDQLANSPVSMIFARIIGITETEITATATAVLQKARYMPPGSDILPFAMPKDVWDQQNPGDTWSIYGDGRLEDDEGDEIPGNWGTLDVGDSSNSTSDLSDQIRNGIRQEDLDALHSDGTIPNNNYIDGSQTMSLNADTGLSSGLKQAVRDVHGERKIVPIYNAVTGSGGNNVVYEVVGWGVVEVVRSRWAGSGNTYIEVKKSYTYDGDLLPTGDLSDTNNVIDGAFTSPVLAQ